MITLHLCRHGETRENVQRILQGHLPGHLSATGRHQAEELGEKLRKIEANHIICSDLQRCIDTAHIALGDDADLIIEPLLRERDWGKLTGQTIEFARTQSFDSAEPIEALLARVERLLLKWQNLYDGETLIAFGHGLTNRAIIAVCTNTDINEVPKMSNAEVRTINIETPIATHHSSSESGATDS